MKFFKTLAVVSAFTFASFGANAQSTGTVRFNGNIGNACNLTSFVDGTITVSANARTLASTETGGTPATFTATTNSANFNLTFGTPVLTGPNGPVGNATFTVTPSTTSAGQALVGTVAGVLGLPLPRVYQVVVNASATLPAGQAFDAGTYTLQIPVSCSK